MSMHGGPAAYFAMRGFTSDKSVIGQKLGRQTINRIGTYAVEFKPQIFFYLVVLVIQSVIVVAQPLLFKKIVDEAIPAGDSNSVIKIAILIGAIAIFEAAIGVLNRWQQSSIGETLILKLRTQVFDHVQRQSIAFFTRTQTGALVSRLNGDVLGAQRAFTSTLGGIVGNVISLTIVLITMFTLSWRITIASLLLLPIFLYAAKGVGIRLQKLTTEQAELNADMSSQVAERFNVSGALLMKLFGTPDREVQIYSEKALKVRNVGVRITMAATVFFTAMMLVGSVAAALVYGMGGVSVVAGTLTLGTLLAMVALLSRLYTPMAALANVRVDVMTALVSFDRVFEVLDLQPMVADAPDAVELNRGSAKVELRDVQFRYPTAEEVSLASLESIARSDFPAAEEMILKGINLTVNPGQLVAIVGPSGAGKSTLTSLVPRLFDPVVGQVLINEIDIRTVTSSSLQKVVGVVTQDSHMFHDTIRTNLIYAKPEATDEQIWKACEDAQIANMIRDLPEGLETVVGDRGHRLSGGEKQRLAIARLLLKAPDVVILDEATAHLDSENEALVQAALANALKDRTSIVIAHRLATIRQADLIVVLNEGKIVEEGTHDELLDRSGLYADLYNRQFVSVD
jgi:ATP-binding cassette subfamily B protein